MDRAKWRHMGKIGRGDPTSLRVWRDHHIARFSHRLLMEAQSEDEFDRRLSRRCHCLCYPPVLNTRHAVTSSCTNPAFGGWRQTTRLPPLAGLRPVPLVKFIRLWVRRESCRVRQDLYMYRPCESM